jgi:hypothetical protein
MIPNPDLAPYIYILSDTAVPTDPGSGLNMGKIPDSGPLSDLDIVVDIAAFVDKIGKFRRHLSSSLNKTLPGAGSGVIHLNYRHKCNTIWPPKQPLKVPFHKDYKEFLRVRRGESGEISNQACYLHESGV